MYRVLYKDCFGCFSVSLFYCLTAACLLLLSFNKD